MPIGGPRRRGRCADSVKMIGPWWEWDSAPGVAAADNGDGTWTFTSDVAPEGGNDEERCQGVTAFSPGAKEVEHDAGD